MTRDLFDRLRAEAIDQASEAAAVEGYFSATVKITLSDEADDDGRTIVRMAIDPGEPT